MNVLFLKQEEGFVYYDDDPERHFPTELINLLDEWEDLIHERKKHPQHIIDRRGNVLFLRLNESYHRAIRKEMNVFDEICSFGKKTGIKVFSTRRHLTMT